jgi:hypothetical protein
VVLGEVVPQCHHDVDILRIGSTDRDIGGHIAVHHHHVTRRQGRKLPKSERDPGPQCRIVGSVDLDVMQEGAVVEEEGSERRVHEPVEFSCLRSGRGIARIGDHARTPGSVPAVPCRGWQGHLPGQISHYCIAACCHDATRERIGQVRFNL